MGPKGLGLPEGQAAAITTDRQTEIPAALEQLESQAHHIRELTNRLKHRLGPISRQEDVNDPINDPAKAPPRPRQFETELANIIDETTNILRDASIEVEDIFRRLEI